MKTTMFMVCMGLIMNLYTYESYVLIPSIALKPYTVEINQAIKAATSSIYHGDFYLNNIARFVATFLTKLPSYIKVEVKGLWRKRMADGTHKNIIYLFLIQEEPIIEPY